MKINLDRFHAFSHRLMGVVLLWAFWWIPIGLHRIWMRRERWWVFLLLFMLETFASAWVWAQPFNQKIAVYGINGHIPSPIDYSGGWLLVVITVVWLIFMAYDAVMIFCWPVPHDAKNSQ